MNVVLPILFSLDNASEILPLEKDVLTISTERLALVLSSTVQVRVMLNPLGQIGLGLSLTNVTEVGAGTRDHIISVQYLANIQYNI